jgi:catechol 2,3-dioxygenase-like lactoylglutathione lyase family enzyme
MSAETAMSVPTQRWLGINHVTLATPDLEATVAFYRDVLEMRVLFEAPANPHHGRHAMISAGGDGLGFHFFEVLETRIDRLPGIVPSKPGEFVPTPLQHIALTLANESAAEVLRERLNSRGVPITSVIEPGRFAPGMRIFLFPDPTGILLKAVWFSEVAA